mmetsp:Transcript_30205/g.73517  ORF Transcript_30205/g.73517 Transcript_30205/m.73517 type:complete len:457 (+) Transcript_30205:224-1594(+)
MRLLDILIPGLISCGLVLLMGAGYTLLNTEESGPAHNVETPKPIGPLPMRPNTRLEPVAGNLTVINVTAGAPETTTPRPTPRPTPLPDQPDQPRKERKRPPPYPTWDPPHSPSEPEPPDPISPDTFKDRERKYFIFTVDNRDVRGKGYRPYVAAANQLWSMVTPLREGREQHEFLYLRSNLSCSLPDCPTFPGKQVNKFCCTGPKNDGSVKGSVYEKEDRITNKPIPVHPSWMDLKGILHVFDNFMKRGDVGLYLDSDAYMDLNKNKTFLKSFEWMMPEFFNGSKPIAVVRDRSHWTAVCRTDFGGPYTKDVNSGIIMFVKNKNARGFLERLWQSALVVSPQDKRKEVPLYYQFGWPHEQERLSWFASTPSENASIAYIQRMGWHKELPWCFQAICHRNFDKMPYIENSVKETLLASARCDLDSIRPYCTSEGKLDNNLLDKFVEFLVTNVKVVPM